MRLGPLIWALIGIDAILIIVVALLVTGVIWQPPATSQDSGSPTASAPSQPGPSESATSDGDQDDETVFASPTRNIACTVSAAQVTCGAAELASPPQQEDGCELSVGYVVTLSAVGVELPCAQRPAVADAGVAVLEYGQSAVVGDITCESTEAGVTCTDARSGAGFRIARAGITNL